MINRSEDGHWQIMSKFSFDGDLQPLSTDLIGHTSEIRSIVLSGYAVPESFLGTELLGFNPSVRLISGGLKSCLGTVRLAIDAESFLNFRHIYWEDVQDVYGAPLCRMVVSSKEVPNKQHRKVVPSEILGPLYQFPSGDWAGRAGCSYEFLVDSSCPFSLFNCITFQPHNSAYCLRYGDFCKQSDSDKSVCELLALAISRPDLSHLASLIRSSGFIVNEQLLIPFAIWLRHIERTSSLPKQEISEDMLQEAFLKLGMGDEQGALEIFSRTEKDRITQFLVRGLEKVLGTSLQTVGLILR